MDKEKSIKALQIYITGLTEGALVHKIQGQIFKSQGFVKLGEKYIGHFNEEMEWVEKFVERILDLGGEVKFEAMKNRKIITDPVKYLKEDLKIQSGIDVLYECVNSLTEDPTTHDIMKSYLKDEEEDLYWSQEQVELIEKIGEQNWLLQQL
ncbi:Bacterioferritin [Porphyromonas macacae]|uniref:Bacterioferritin n=1 Tax=Porphyromonas macacae TaxID=28115 RepID=A0A379E9G5_9PORP|nr:ferritin-like domain-containing protein [Porphyromonas macacae]SUB89100.1 Bacterioferritin [Porphyromonas macacae]